MFNFGPGHPLTSLPVVIGHSPAILDAIDVADRVADTTAGVLIEGESGTGKELLARFLHHRSRRCRGPFVPVNCAALAANGSLERELFGVEALGSSPAARVGK